MVGVTGGKAFAAGLDLKGARDGVFRQDLPGRAKALRLAVLQQKQIVTKIDRKIEVMHRDDDGQWQVPDQIEDLELMPDIQMVRRFVEDQKTGLLRQGAGDNDALALAARESAKMTTLEMLKAEPIQGVLDDLPVMLAAGSGKAAPMGYAAQRDDVLNGQGEVAGVLLQNGRDPLGDRARRLAPYVGAVD